MISEHTGISKYRQAAFIDRLCGVASYEVCVCVWVGVEWGEDLVYRIKNFIV